MADATVKIRGGAGNATQLQSRDIDSAAPADTNVLAWSASDSEWEPTAAGGGGSSEWTDTGTVLHPTDSSGTVDSVIVGGDNTSNADIVLGVDGSAIFNQQAADVDFTVAGVGAPAALVVQGSDGFVGVGTASPTEFFEVEGATPFLSIRNTAETEAGIILSDSDAPIAQFARLLLDSGSTESGLIAGFSIMTAGGTLTGTINAPASGTTITGVGTAFLTELVVGDRLILRADGTSDALAEIRTITAIASNTSLTVVTAFSDLGIDSTPAFEVRAMQFKSNGAIGMGINPTTGAEKVVLDGAMALKSQASSASATADYGKIYTEEYGNDANVKLLLHMDGADDGTTFTDSSASAHTVTATGTVTKTGVKKFGTASGYFDGSDVLTIADSADFTFGADPFTIEFWAYPTSIATTWQCLAFMSASNEAVLLGYESASGQDYGFFIDINNGGTYNSTPGSKTGKTGIYDDTWYHVAFVREATELRCYLNGVLKNTYDIGTTAVNDPTGDFTIGGPASSGMSNDYRGYFDEFTITKEARYTANFTPARSAFPVTNIVIVDDNGGEYKLGRNW